MTFTKNLIIGAGPAGLGIAGSLRKAGIDFEIIEQSEKIASSWGKHYDRLHLHTVKQLSHLPHLPFPADYPTYIPKNLLINYYEEYASQFSITPHFNQEVIAIEKRETHWFTKTKNGESYRSENVIIATGVNRIPNCPNWPGQESFEGQIIHARDYKNAKPFSDKKILVVGMGNTGAELALDLSEQGIETYLSVRGSVSVVPRDLNGRPVQLTGIQLAKLPFGIGDWLGNQIRKIYLGNLEKYGLKSPKLSPAQQLKLTGKTPVIDIGTIRMIKAGKIKVVPEIDHFYPSGIVTRNDQRIELDGLILATGYRAQIEDFLKDKIYLFNKDGLPVQPIAKGKDKGLFFIGFNNYILGGILGTIRSESELITRELLERMN